MSPDDLAAILARAEAATKGPWEARTVECADADYITVIEEDGGALVCEAMMRADSVFIAAARTDIPALVAEVRRLEAAIADLEKSRSVICSCGKRGATYGPDPYASDINDDDTPVWECEDCRHESAMDI